ELTEILGELTNTKLADGITDDGSVVDNELPKNDIGIEVILLLDDNGIPKGDSDNKTADEK
ncbi:MAG: hypothetical protein N4Q32_03535, partial [Neisseriaceae bacterium]|nr:hypothetical protein [Neisseriaceae bacterium]